MSDGTAISDIGHAIQLAVAPVFLLSGIGAMLAVMTNRLARVIDRARGLESEFEEGPADAESIRLKLAVLSRRARLAGLAITLCTITALLICALIALLFISAFLDFHAGAAIALLFVAAMFTFFSGLVAFLREILLATSTLRIGVREELTRVESLSADRSAPGSSGR
ncbi:MAG: DUF2721 domain-containing protein [Phycisphaerales bacterium]